MSILAVSDLARRLVPSTAGEAARQLERGNAERMRLFTEPRRQSRTSPAITWRAADPLAVQPLRPSPRIPGDA
jgi:hypothetical protein